MSGLPQRAVEGKWAGRGRDGKLKNTIQIAEIFDSMAASGHPINKFSILERTLIVIGVREADKTSTGGQVQPSIRCIDPLISAVQTEIG